VVKKWAVAVVEEEKRQLEISFQSLKIILHTRRKTIFSRWQIRIAMISFLYQYLGKNL
jgi:hypothetical protein